MIRIHAIRKFPMTGNTFGFELTVTMKVIELLYFQNITRNFSFAQTCRLKGIGLYAYKSQRRDCVQCVPKYWPTEFRYYWFISTTNGNFEANFSRHKYSHYRSSCGLRAGFKGAGPLQQTAPPNPSYFISGSIDSHHITASHLLTPSI